MWALSPNYWRLLTDNGSTGVSRYTIESKGPSKHRKEELQREIEEEQDRGYNGLLEEDQFLAEVNLDDLEESSGERQEYWLVAIRAAR